MKKHRSMLLAAACIVAAAVPIWRLLHFLSSVGMDNPSNDSVMIVKVVDEIINGRYLWRNLFYDTFLNGHANVFSTLLQALLAHLFEWRIPWVLYFGTFLSFASLVLLFDSFSCLLQGKGRWILLPILSFLVFSPSQISAVEFEFIAATNGLNHLGFCLGLWGLVRFRKRWLGFSLMMAGGLLTSWSFGGGLAAWPVFFLGMYAFGFRRKSQAILALGGLLLSSAPYAYFLILNPKPNAFRLLEGGSPGSAWGVSSFFHVPFLLRSIGLALSQNLELAAALWRGSLGACLLALLLFLFFRQFKGEIRQKVFPPLLALLYGLGILYLTSIVRQNPAPWYTSPGMFFWIGAVGAAFGALDNFSWGKMRNGLGKTARLSLLPLVSFSFLALLGYFYVSSNLSFEDKSFYLRTRAPASASCLRHYRTAPESCYPVVFLWPNGKLDLLKQLGEFLEKNRLSLFSKRQERSLQGDFSFEEVRKIQAENVPKIFWSADLSSQEAASADFHRLNLFLHTPNAVEWTVELPSELESADFLSGIAISSSAPHSPDADGVVFEINAIEEGGKKTLLFSQFLDAEQREWVPLQFSLKRFAGKKVTIQLTSGKAGNIDHDWAMYRYPHIRLTLN